MPANKLSQAERDKVVEIANGPEYRDLSPKQIVPRLVDQGVYVASESTVYRVLREQDQMAHLQRSRPATARRPYEYVATGPNQVWVWEISYLPGPVRGPFFYLYLILDVRSRKIVGAKVYADETSARASQLFVQTCWRLGIDPDGLVLHSDNGSPMKGSRRRLPPGGSCAPFRARRLGPCRAPRARWRGASRTALAGPRG